MRRVVARANAAREQKVREAGLAHFTSQDVMQLVGVEPLDVGAIGTPLSPIGLAIVRFLQAGFFLRHRELLLLYADRATVTWLLGFFSAVLR